MEKRGGIVKGENTSKHTPLIKGKMQRL